MKYGLIIFSLLLLSSSLMGKEVPTYVFDCETVDAGEDIALHVELVYPSDTHPMEGMSAVKGTMTIRTPNYKEVLQVRYFPNYSRFSLRRLKDGNSEYEFKLSSDDRVLREKKQIAAVFEVNRKGSDFSKSALYKMMCIKF